MKGILNNGSSDINRPSSSKWDIESKVREIQRAPVKKKSPLLSRFKLRHERVNVLYRTTVPNARHLCPCSTGKFLGPLSWCLEFIRAVLCRHTHTYRTSNAECFPTSAMQLLVLNTRQDTSFLNLWICLLHQQYLQKIIVIFIAISRSFHIHNH